MKKVILIGFSQLYLFSMLGFLYYSTYRQAASLPDCSSPLLLSSLSDLMDLTTKEPCGVLHIE